MKKIATLIASTVVCLSLFVATPIAQAADLGGTQYFDTPEIHACVDGGNNQIICTVIQIFNWLAIGVSTVVVIMVVVGAIQYITAGGSQENAKKAIETIRNAIIALAMYMVMWVFLNWLVPGGLFYQ